MPSYGNECSTCPATLTMMKCAMWFVPLSRFVYSMSHAYLCDESHAISVR